MMESGKATKQLNLPLVRALRQAVAVWREEEHKANNYEKLFCFHR